MAGLADAAGTAVTGSGASRGLGSDRTASRPAAASRFGRQVRCDGGGLFGAGAATRANDLDLAAEAARADVVVARDGCRRRRQPDRSRPLRRPRSNPLLRPILMPRAATRGLA